MKTRNNLKLTLPDEFKAIGNAIIEVELGNNYYDIGSILSGDFKRLASKRKTLLDALKEGDITEEEFSNMEYDYIEEVLLKTFKFYNKDCDIEVLESDFDNTTPTALVMYSMIMLDAHNFVKENKNKLPLVASKKKVKS